MPEGDYAEILKNGVILCRLMNKINPTSIIKFKEKVGVCTNAPCHICSLLLFFPMRALLRASLVLSCIFSPINIDNTVRTVVLCTLDPFFAYSPLCFIPSKFVLFLTFPLLPLFSVFLFRLLKVCSLLCLNPKSSYGS
jgi:hypothetical protein